VLKEVLMEWTSYLARDERGRSGSICVRFERTSKNRVCRGWGYWYFRSIILREVHHAICVRYAIMSKSVGKKPSLPQFAKIWPKIFVAII